MAVFWLLVIIIFFVLEAVSFNLVTIWFAVGGIGAFITTYFTDNTLMQFIIFVGVTVISLISTRPVIKKYLKVKSVRTNLDAVIGKVGIVTQKINKDQLGRVKVDGKEWTAKADTLIKENTKVEILAIEGVKLIVRKKEEK
ncbi:MAG: NfeD family protein [Bacilli bacterium]|nr:NfeD family protein [Bacilli bacterium]